MVHYITFMTMGQMIRELRIRHGWKQEELSHKSGISQNMISRIENDLRKTPAWTTIHAIAGALGVSLDKLVTGSLDDTKIDKINKILNALPDDYLDDVLDYCQDKRDLVKIRQEREGNVKDSGEMEEYIGKTA